MEQNLSILVKYYLKCVVAIATEAFEKIIQVFRIVVGQLIRDMLQLEDETC